MPSPPTSLSVRRELLRHLSAQHRGPAGWTSCARWGPPTPGRPGAASPSPARCRSPTGPASGRGSPAGCCCGWRRSPSQPSTTSTRPCTRMPWEDHLEVDGTLAVEVTSTISQGPLGDRQHPLRRAAGQGRGRRPLPRPDGKAAGSGAGPARRPHRRPSGAGGDRRQPRPLRRRPAPARLPAGGRRSAAQGEPGRRHPAAGRMARHRRRGRGAARPHVRLGHPAHRGRSHGRRHRPRPAAASTTASSAGKASSRRSGSELLDEAGERPQGGARPGSPVSSAPTAMRARSAPPAPTPAGRVWPGASSLERPGSGGAGGAPRRRRRAWWSPTRPTASAWAKCRSWPGLYETLGERLKASFSGWEAAVFTANPDLTAHLGLRARRVNVLYNGPLDAQAAACSTIGPAFAADRPGRRRGRPAAPGAAAPRRRPAGASAAGRPPGAATGAGALMFANRLQKNLKHLRRWAARENISCYRVYDADLPEYAVAVDLYDGWAHVQEYAPPEHRRPGARQAAPEGGDGGRPRGAGDTRAATPCSRCEAPSGGPTSTRSCRSEASFLRGGGGRPALPGQPHRLPRHRPLPRSPAHPAAHPRAGARTAFPEPLRLHRLGHGLRGGRRSGVHHHRRPVARLPRVGARATWS